MLLAGLQADALQEPESSRERTRLEGELKRYHGIVNSYREGKNDAVDAIVAWDRERLKKIVAAAQSPLDVFRPWDVARAQAATMLHTDAAMRLLEAEPDRVSFQLEMATRLLRIAGPDLHPFARSWYIAVSRRLRDRAQLFMAEGLLERGREHLPNDPSVLYESGVLHEQIATFAAVITETVTSTPPPFSRGPGTSLQSMASTSRSEVNRNIQERRRALDRAHGWLRDAVRADSSSELSQLHLGRVQVLRGNDSDGAKLLQRLTSSADPDTCYLATMFLGAMHQRRGRHDQAEAMYRRAIDKIPSAQAAYVALSEVLQKLGRGDESRGVLDDLLRHPAAKRTEPWWWYLAEPAGEARQRLDVLRASVRQP
jgi:tetratricopeptide (TPR) repeat protein